MIFMFSDPTLMYFPGFWLQLCYFPISFVTFEDDVEVQSRASKSKQIENEAEI